MPALPLREGDAVSQWGNLTESEARLQLARAVVTLQEIADCDEHGHTGMTWAQNEAWACLRDMRTLIEPRPADEDDWERTALESEALT